MARRRSRCRWSIPLLAGLLLPSGIQPAGSAEPSAEGNTFFESKVRPILVDHCWKCHGEKKPKGNLRLDSRSALLTGGDHGPAIVPGQPDKSLLIKALGHDDDHLKMPPSRKLAREQIGNLALWVKMGAPWPGDSTKTTAAPVRTGKQISDQDRAHWAFQPVKRPIPPAGAADWVGNPIDAFVLARLQAKGLIPNPPAARHELVRRVYYDLTGLPPTPEEMAAVLADSSPDWYERLIDRLLESPRYGEKWARHWLDLVRFAETNSYERDNPKPNAWRYRDYVIRAFNADKPFNRFIIEQLAGDELDSLGADAAGSTESIIATGFYRLGIWDDEPSDRELARYDGLDDIVTTVGQVFLGLTIDCARCHDHKIDPIPQRDYYRLLAFFQNINHYRNGGPTDEIALFSDPGSKQAYEERVKALEDSRRQLQTVIASFEDDFAKLYEQVEGKKPSAAELSKIVLKDGARLLGKERLRTYVEQRKQLEGLKKQTVPAEKALCVTEAGTKCPDTFLLVRGNPHSKGEKVEPGFPLILGGQSPSIPVPSPRVKSSGRRRVLADWIASPDNPLTARVMVNRIWQQHFGRGIVRSSSNFGLQGDAPTHPELLDWLAAEFISHGWKMKPIHRLILTSNTYRMSSRPNPVGLKIDPANDLFWRFDMRRLCAEEIRDSILAVSGSLNLKMFGPGVYPEIPREVLAGQSVPGRGWGTSPLDEQNRRSIYVHVKRSLLLPILESFDLAEPDRSTAVRFTTTQPTQALLMLNSEFIGKQAAVLARRLRTECGPEVTLQVRRGLFLATQRPPTDREIDRGVRLIETLRQEGASEETALQQFCLLLLNLNEFVYVD